MLQSQLQARHNAGESRESRQLQRPAPVHLCPGNFAALGERIYRTEQDKLAAQLPKELREYLSSRAQPETMRGDTDRYSLEEFYNRVSAREIGLLPARDGQRDEQQAVAFDRRVRIGRHFASAGGGKSH